MRSAESKDVGAAALMLAVKQAFPGAAAEPTIFPVARRVRSPCRIGS